jgi:hypothetical protein
MPKFGGRAKGTPNKTSLPLKELAEKLNCNPFEILLRFAMGDAKGLGYAIDTVGQTTPKGEIIEKPLISPEMRIKAASEAAQYLYPKRKAIEHSGEITSVQVEKLKPEQINSILRGDPFLGTNGNETHQPSIERLAATVAATTGGSTET